MGDSEREGGVMNIENAKKLVDQLKRLPDERFWMAEYIAHPEEFLELNVPRPASCGTVACIAGWASLANGGPNFYCDVYDWATEWLGLREEESWRLFLGEWSPKNLSQITRSEAIAELERLIAAAQ